jgi:predicted metal-binding protein
MTNLRKSIYFLQQTLRKDYKDDKDLLEALDILYVVEKRPKTLLKLEKIASTYHDKDIFAGVTVSRDCPICEKHILNSVCIESDILDYSKDLYICTECYMKLHMIWKDKTPKKICPV